MNVKELRMSRILNPKSGKSVIIPIDHGIVMGNVEGLEDPLKILKQLIDIGIDGTLLSPGIGKISLGLFSSKDAPGRILTADIPLLSTVPGGSGEVVGHEIIADVEFALRYNFDIVKVLLPWGEREHVQMESVRVVSNLANECDRWNMPLMVEPVLWGEEIPKEKRNDPKLIEHASRMALEMGADILKIPYTGNKSEFRDLVNDLKVPIFVLGGPKMDSVEGVLKVAKESIEAGAKGIVFGRNVWQNPKMKDLVKALKSIIHNGSSLTKVIKDFNLVR
ncbi:class I fructose-bisphosphate aldolase [Athalassotoga saccharophila]|uniref:class I fructose-bisphosphate aldolase n=1 Tax=Athalassotoga saccharophila TaxID=1441386 RepID=UPI00137B19B9|nr:fructose-bisphosphate aldolase [Athalassotoga saccharophila]BBJ27385.1 fructose-bisphosphate aldolase [Athalassotoga saccharophila]